MFTFMQPSEKSVVEGLEEYEMVYAKEQQDLYNPLRVIRGSAPQVPVLSRWTLTPEQREAIAGGADIYLELLVFTNAQGQPKPLSPIRMAVGQNVDPDYVRVEYSLP